MSWIAVGVGGVALAGGASGALGSGLLSGNPAAPSTGDIIGGSQSYLYTGMTLAQQKQFAKLKAMDSRTPAQTKQLEFLENRSKNAPLNQQMDALNKYLPQYNDLMLELIDKYAPKEIEQQAKYGQQMGEAFMNAQKALAPEFYNLRSAEAKNLAGQVGTGLTGDQTKFASNQLRAGQAARGLFDSPLGSEQEMYQLTALDQAQRQINDAQVQSFLNNFSQPFIPQIGGGVSPLPGAGFAGGALNAPSLDETMGIRSNVLGLKFGRNTQQASQGATAGAGALSGISSALSGLMGGGMMGGGGMSGLGGGSAAAFNKPGWGSSTAMPN